MSMLQLGYSKFDAMIPENISVCSYLRNAGVGMHHICSFKVDVFSFSEGAGEYPWTRESNIHIKDTLKDLIIWRIDVVIHMSSLAVHLSPECWEDPYKCPVY